MKVLVQEWRLAAGGTITSINKDIESIKLAAARSAEGDLGHERYGEPSEITIPDDSVFADMVESSGFVFLHPDEMDIVYDCPEFHRD